jgi:hypothetical protein
MACIIGLIDMDKVLPLATFDATLTFLQFLGREPDEQRVFVWLARRDKDGTRLRDAYLNLWRAARANAQCRQELSPMLRKIGSPARVDWTEVRRALLRLGRERRQAPAEPF